MKHLTLTMAAIVLLTTACAQSNNAQPPAERHTANDTLVCHFGSTFGDDVAAIWSNFARAGVFPTTETNEVLIYNTTAYFAGIIFNSVEFHVVDGILTGVSYVYIGNASDTASAEVYDELKAKFGTNAADESFGNCPAFMQTIGDIVLYCNNVGTTTSLIITRKK